MEQTRTSSPHQADADVIDFEPHLATADGMRVRSRIKSPSAFAMPDAEASDERRSDSNIDVSDPLLFASLRTIAFCWGGAQSALQLLSGVCFVLLVGPAILWLKLVCMVSGINCFNMMMDVFQLLEGQE